MNYRWNEIEKQFLRENVSHLTDEEGAKMLSKISTRKVSENAWRKQRQRLGFKKKHGRGICELVETKTVPGLNGEVRYVPTEWLKRKPNVMHLGKAAYIKPELWPVGVDYVSQDQIKELIKLSEE